MNSRLFWSLAICAAIAGCGQQVSTIPTDGDKIPSTSGDVVEGEVGDSSQSTPNESGKGSVAKVNPNYGPAARTFRFNPEVELPNHQETIREVTFSADGELVASVAECINICDTQSGDLVTTIPLEEKELEESDPVRLSFAPDRSLLAVAHGDRVALHDVETGKLTKTLTAGDSDDDARRIQQMLSVQFTGDGKWLVVAAPFRLLVFETESFSLRRELACEVLQADAMVVTPDSKQVIVPGRTSAVECYDIVSGELAYQIERASAETEENAGPSTISSMAISPDGSRLATASYLDQLSIIDLKTKETLFATEQPCSRMAFPSKDRLALVDGGIALFQINQNSLTMLTNLPIRKYSPHTCIKFSPVTDQVAITGFRTPNQARLFQLESSQEKDAIASRKESFAAIATSPNEQQLAFVSGNMLNVVATKDGKSIKRRKLDDVSDRSVALEFSSTGERLLLRSGSEYDFRLMLFTLPGLDLQGEFAEKFGYFHDARFTPDGSEILMTGERECRRLFVAKASRD